MSHLRLKEWGMRRPFGQVICGPRYRQKVEIFILFLYILRSVRDEFYHTTYIFGGYWQSLFAFPHDQFI